ncbi:hypothetical protein SLEP1_g56094 [Rubroshorea leprosula]|uniref:NB-ARC domain-containing protein n=1 Tax=Rubroshorea leprosula TaxID=152421 RepID=A0AAV5MKH1_9ROSI|nr:hypothetical protein SLEP1_g56094 [Rubroshorea leprosula]
MSDPFTNAVVEKVAENIADRILNFILNPITVVRDCTENVENLKSEVEKLKDKKKQVENHKADVGRKGEVIDETVQTWLTHADKFIKAAEEPVRDGDEFAKKECFFRLCPNLIPRYKLSKEAEKNSKNIVEHLKVASQFGSLSLSHAPPPQQDVATLVKCFEEFGSRKIVLDQIMEALRSPTVNRIGLHGTSGMRKTMLVKMVKAKAKKDSLFTAVVMAAVTKDWEVKSIQEEIARDLDMDLLSFTDTHRQLADPIRAKLKEVKKVLLILDDVWETDVEQHFEKFGIPSESEMKQAMERKNEESSSGEEDMLCKILLTSRFHHVLSSIIDEKDPIFEVRKLEDDEPWDLFKKTVGSDIENSDFQQKAKEIVEKCLGLPVAIVSVGKAMRRKTKQFEWDNALTELKKPSPEGISAAVYNPIELNYINLKEEELKQTFILCSLLSRNSSIDDLLKCGMGLDLFQKVNTIEETRAKVLSLVCHLKSSSLLVDGESSLHFEMHDQIQEVAFYIAFRDRGGLALVDEAARRKLKDKKSLEKLKWLSLPNGDIELPANEFQCPQLTFFYLSNKAQSLQFPSEFFKKADGLHVLCLTKVDFKSMPLPIPLIPTNLHSLLLDRCAFKVEGLRAIMGNLENLEVLSLAGCDIEELPIETEKLSKLKILDVSDCTKLRVIPRQVLASLSRSLEELKMGDSFNQWNVEEGNARLDELAVLHKLTALEVRIPNFRAILFPENLRRFKIFLGEVEVWYPWEGSFESSRRMKLKLQGASIKSDDSLKKLLKKTEELCLQGLNGVENLVCELDDEGFQHLKSLCVEDAPDIRCIFNPAGRLLPSHVFPILEVLTLFNLEKMGMIRHGLTGAAPFKVLRKIMVVECHQLKNLFSFSMARQLQLQEITVRSCDNIEEIIDDVEEQGNGNDIVEESEGCKLGGSLRLCGP